MHFINIQKAGNANWNKLCRKGMIIKLLMTMFVGNKVFVEAIKLYL